MKALGTYGRAHGVKLLCTGNCYKECSTLKRLFGNIQSTIYSFILDFFFTDLFVGFDVEVFEARTKLQSSGHGVFVLVVQLARVQAPVVRERGEVEGDAPAVPADTLGKALAHVASFEGVESVSAKCPVDWSTLLRAHREIVRARRFTEAVSVLALLIGDIKKEKDQKLRELRHDAASFCPFYKCRKMQR